MGLRQGGGLMAGRPRLKRGNAAPLADRRRKVNMAKPSRRSRARGLRRYKGWSMPPFLCSAGSWVASSAATQRSSSFRTTVLSVIGKSIIALRQASTASLMSRACRSIGSSVVAALAFFEGHPPGPRSRAEEGRGGHGRVRQRQDRLPRPCDDGALLQPRDLGGAPRVT
jgi:hypothetical protein